MPLTNSAVIYKGDVPSATSFLLLDSVLVSITSGEDHSWLGDIDNLVD